VPLPLPKIEKTPFVFIFGKGKGTKFPFVFIFGKGKGTKFPFVSIFGINAPNLLLCHFWAGAYVYMINNCFFFLEKKTRKSNRSKTDTKYEFSHFVMNCLRQKLKKNEFFSIFGTREKTPLFFCEFCPK
jgi:hypothetical protein